MRVQGAVGQGVEPDGEVAASSIKSRAVAGHRSSGRGRCDSQCVHKAGLDLQPHRLVDATVVRTARRYRTVQIRAGQHLLTGEDPLSVDLADALAKITGAEGPHQTDKSQVTHRHTMRPRPES